MNNSKWNTHRVLPPTCPSPICFLECSPILYKETLQWLNIWITHGGQGSEEKHMAVMRGDGFIRDIWVINTQEVNLLGHGERCTFPGCKFWRLIVSDFVLRGQPTSRLKKRLTRVSLYNYFMFPHFFMKYEEADAAETVALTAGQASSFRQIQPIISCQAVLLI